MNSTPHRRLALAAAIAASALTLTGCAQLPALAFPTVEQRPAHPLTTKTFAEQVSGAEKDVRSFHESLSAQSGKKSLSIEADTAMTAAGLAMRETVTVTGSPAANLVLVAGKLYVKSPKVNGGTWATVDLTALAQQLGASATNLGVSSSAPADQIAKLQKAIAYVQPSGQPVEVDGVQSVPYVVAINTAQDADFLGPLALVASALPPQLDYDWWIGSDGLPRRYTVVAAGISEDVRFTKWNAAVKIEPPVGTPVTTGAPAQTAALLGLSPGARSRDD